MSSHSFVHGAHDVPLLYETGHASDFDRVVVTKASAAAQLARLGARGLSESYAHQRIAAQLPTDEKATRADYVITTDGTFDETDRQVKDVCERIRTACK